MYGREDHMGTTWASIKLGRHQQAKERPQEKPPFSASRSLSTYISAVWATWSAVSFHHSPSKPTVCHHHYCIIIIIVLFLLLMPCWGMTPGLKQARQVFYHWATPQTTAPFNATGVLCPGLHPLSVLSRSEHYISPQGWASSFCSWVVQKPRKNPGLLLFTLLPPIPFTELGMFKDKSLYSPAFSRSVEWESCSWSF